MRHGLAGCLELRFDQGEQNKDRTAHALSQRSQLGSVAARVTPLKRGRVFPEASSGTKCYRACNPFPAMCWLARGVPSILSLPTAASSRPAHRTPEFKGEGCGVLLLCSQRHRCTEPAEVFCTPPCRVWLQNSWSHPTLLEPCSCYPNILAQVTWVQISVLILVCCGALCDFFCQSCSSVKQSEYCFIRITFAK